MEISTPSVFLAESGDCTDSPRRSVTPEAANDNPAPADSDSPTLPFVAWLVAIGVVAAELAFWIAR